MSDPRPRTCPRCLAEIPAGDANQLCPACVMSRALVEDGLETASGTPHRASMTPPPAVFPHTFGGYRLLGLLGAGGMGTVYEAEHRATGRRVALKLLEHRLDSPDMRRRFLREGRLAARVNHPNSLYVFGSEEIEGIPTISMEVAGGGTLEDLLQKRGPLPLAEAVDAVLDVIAGLEAAHAGGVLHRDVKPANCFVSPDGTVLVGDYGLSVSTLATDDSLITATDTVMGTPAFAPPEQLRGDELDLRTDIYSVGATLFALLTGRPPFQGRNAVQVVANAVNESPPAVGDVRDGVPPALERIVARCLAKDPAGRYDDYAALRSALLPFSSRQPEPASILRRLSAGWIDYLVAFLPAYVALMLTVGAEALLIRPLVERTLASAAWYLGLLGVGCLYFTLAEGIWGRGLGKGLKGLRVVRTNGRRPGVGRALLRILVPILCVEGVRMPLTMAFISTAEWTGLQTVLFVLTAVACGWIPLLLMLRARPENGFETLWDRVSGTHVVVKPEAAARPGIEPIDPVPAPVSGAAWLGPYEPVREVTPGAWIAAVDPVLRRPVWLFKRSPSGLSDARKQVARSGRLRWLQSVETPDAIWDAFEAPPGRSFAGLVDAGQHIPWATLRRWLHDLASELWAAARDRTLPAEASLDHVWIAADGRALLLDEPWPDARVPAERTSLTDLTGQQLFLSNVASTAEASGLPLHARPMLTNLADGRFEKLSFLTGTIRGLLEWPTEVGRGLRAASLFVFPLFVGIALYVGRYHDKPSTDAVPGLVFVATVVLVGTALIQLLELPFRSTVSLFVFRLAVVDERGEPASRKRRLARWAIVWLPLLVVFALAALLREGSEVAALLTVSAAILLWLGTVLTTVVHPRRGLHDRLAGTWIVRR